MKKILYLPLLAPLWLAAVWAGQAQAQIYRCGNTYSNKPCAGAKVVATDRVSVISGGEADKQTILECQDKSGIYWTSTDTCKEGDAQLGTYTAPRGLSLKEQVYIAKMKKQAHASMAPPVAATAPAPAATASAGAEKPLDCAGVAHALKLLDEAKRRQHGADTAAYFAARKQELDAQQRAVCP